MKFRYLSTRFLLVVSIAVLMLMCSQVVSAQLPVVRNFGPKDYGGGTQNWGLALSKNDYLFVANNNGLMVYTGQQWDIVRVPNCSNVHAVYPYPDGGPFYVGAFGEFGYFMNESPLNRADYVSLSDRLPVQSKDFKDIWSIVCSPEGNVIFSSLHHLFVYNPREDTLEALALADEICNLSVLDGVVYVATDRWIYTMQGVRLSEVKGSDGPASGRVSGAYMEGAAKVFATRNGRFYELNSEGEWHTKEYPVLSSALRNSKVFCTASNSVWLSIGTISDGLYAMHRADGLVYHIDRENGLRNNTVLSILIDDADNIWTGLDNGLSYICFDTPFRSLLPEGELGTGYASARHEGMLYLGTNQSLFCMPEPDKELVHTLRAEEEQGIGGQIWTLSNCAGRLLCGANSGTYAIEGKRAVEIEGLGPAWGFRMYPGRDSVAVAATYGGFAVLDLTDKGWKLRHHIKGIDSSSINFEIDNDGKIWYSHWLEGVYCLELTSDLTSCREKRLYNSANQLPTDDNNLVTRIDGKIYLSAADGFYAADRSHRLSRVEWLGRLFPPRGVSSRVIQTDRGNLWAYSPGHLSFARRSATEGKGSGISYKASGLQYSSMVDRLQMNLGNISEFDNRYTMLNYDDGFYLVDPSVDRPKPHKMNIDFVEEDAHGARADSLVYRACPVGAPFRTSPGGSDLFFAWSYPEYRESDAILFSSYIDGYDKEWTEPSAVSGRKVSHIAPGVYTMRIRALNTVSGHEDNFSLDFRVVAPWYKTWWARLIGLLLALALNYLLIRFVIVLVSRRIARRRRLQMDRERQRREKERLEEEKAKAIEHNEALSREIKQKSSELADSDLHNRHNIAMLKNIDSAMTDILEKAAAGVDRAVLVSEMRNVRKTLRMHSVEEVVLERLTENFNIIFDDLLRKLAASYPQLSRNDIALCSYLKLNLSTKQIASVMNLSERSVESNRYRLRKKLGMEAGESFTAFFSRFDREE